MTAWRLLIVVVTLCGSACTSFSAKHSISIGESEARWQQRLVALTKIATWNIKGRIGVRTQNEGGSATLWWRREQDKHHIRLQGPFGSGHVQITQTPTAATLRDGNNRTEYADTATELLYRHLGWHVPFNELAYWISGLPAPGLIEQRLLDAQGRLEILEQAGWVIRFIDYQEAFKSIQLPRKIAVNALPGTIVSETEAADRSVDQNQGLDSELRVKLVINSWELDY